MEATRGGEKINGERGRHSAEAMGVEGGITEARLKEDAEARQALEKTHQDSS